jgi:membrane-associated phospholipid phosphatase
MFGGYHSGFSELHTFTRALLPDMAWANITFIGDTLVALTIGLFFSYRYPKIAIAMIISALLCTLLTQGMKHAFSMGRPLTIFSADIIDVIGPAYKENALPSGHTATAFTLAGLLFRCTGSHSIRQLTLLAAILVGVSRVACGVHWLIDIAVGGALGLLSAWAGIRASDLIRTGINTYTALCSLMLVSAYMLLSHDGGLPATSHLAQGLGFAALFYWLMCWSLTLASLDRRVSRWLGLNQESI